MLFYKLQDLNKYNEWTYFHFPHITFINLLNYQYPGLSTDPVSNLDYSGSKYMMISE
jgi:hypothetical protein